MNPRDKIHDLIDIGNYPVGNLFNVGFPQFAIF
jgi:hypothetical protein